MSRVPADERREAQVAANEALFRSVNEEIRKLSGDRVDLATFVCECGDRSCSEKEKVTPTGRRVVEDTDPRA